MNIVVVGLGLIGGSIAKALSKKTSHHIIGIDRNEAVLQDALSCSAIHEIGNYATLSKADLLYLCLYPHDCVAFFTESAPCLKPDCIVTDAAGTKQYICRELTALSKQYGFLFLGSHPMAGKEQSGFSASDSELFLGASYLLTPCDAPEHAVETVKNLALSMGFESVRLTTPEEHDKQIAFTSQLPHLLACSYVKSPRCMQHKGFSAGSYRDVSRVARINETLWTELFLENREALLTELADFVDHIQQLQEAITHNDADTLKKLLTEGREIKEALCE